MTRVFDSLVSGVLLLLTFPIQLVAALLVFYEDRHWPFFSQPRAGVGGVYFNAHKIRTMRFGSERFAIDVTASDDQRITKTGAFLRRSKIDELPQLWNVFVGEMSLVGPRPQVEREVNRYTQAERGLLVVRPGITDFSSIVFSDLSEIIAGAENPNQMYSEYVRPWKSRLGLFYIRKSTVALDVVLLVLTVTNIFFRKQTLQMIARILTLLGAPRELIDASARQKPLVAALPPEEDYSAL